jgi:hypothetical protein
MIEDAVVTHLPLFHPSAPALQPHGCLLAATADCSIHSALLCNSRLADAVVYVLFVSPGVEYGSTLLILLISLTFALISPLIVIFGAVFCGGMWVYWR